MLKILALYLGSASLAMYVFLYVSALWGGLLFLISAVFVGIPLSGVPPVRLRRMGIYMAAMVFLLIYSATALRYDLFISAEPFVGTRESRYDTIIETKYYLNYHLREVKLFYTCFTQADEYYFIKKQQHPSAAEGPQQYFVAAPATERDFFLSNWGGELDSTKIHLGFLLAGGDASSAVARQNWTCFAVVGFFGFLLLFDDYFFRNKQRKK